MNAPPIPLTAAWWGPHEWRAIASCIALARVAHGPATERLARTLGDLLNSTEIHVLNAGRTAITIALRAFASSRPDRRVVLVPEYVCPAVPDAVERAGLECRSVPVGSDLNITPDALAPKLDDSVLAVIAVHMYGLPAAVDSIESICRSRGVFLVDDAAHGLGVNHVHRPLGTFGDVGVLSFAQAKVITTGVRGSGGALVVSNPSLRQAVDRELAGLRPPSGRLDGLLYFASAYLGGSVGSRLARSIEWTLQKYLPSYSDRRTARRYYPAAIANLDASIALEQLARLNRLLQERQGILDRYVAVSKRRKRPLFPQARHGIFLSRLVVELPEQVSPGDARTKLATLGIQTRLPYPLLKTTPCDLDPTRSRLPPLLELPLARGMTDEDVLRVLDALEEVTGAVSTSRDPEICERQA